MRNKIKGLLIGIIIGAMISATTSLALNANIDKLLEYRDIKICVDGERITPMDADGNYVEPFIIDGTTYLPVRAVANAFGKEVSWDGNTHTVYIGKKPEVKYMDAFAEDIKNIISQYGRYINTEGMGIKGLKYGALIDFEKDNVPELVLCHDMTVEVYRFDGENSTKIYEQKTGARYMQTDVSYTFGINKEYSNPCLITYQTLEEWRSEELHIFTVENEKANIQVLYAEGSDFNEESGYLDDGFDTFKIDGVNVSKDTYMTLRNGIFDGEKEIDVNWADMSFVRDNYIQATRQELDEYLKPFGL